MEEGAIEACQMDDLLYPERSIFHYTCGETLRDAEDTAP
ncbi:unnamed protein product [Ascophyllum nodosum]